MTGTQIALAASCALFLLFGLLTFVVIELEYRTTDIPFDKALAAVLANPSEVTEVIVSRSSKPANLELNVLTKDEMFGYTLAKGVDTIKAVAARLSTVGLHLQEHDRCYLEELSVPGCDPRDVLKRHRFRRLKS